MFAYVSAAMTGVGYNYFIQGSTPYGGSEITPRRSYSTAQIGISFPLHRWFGSTSWPRLVYSQTYRTPEFNGGSAILNQRSQRYGSFNFHWDTGT